MVRIPSVDVVVVGGGPAGLALASELGVRGTRVALLERHLGRPWRASYGSWASAWPVGVTDGAIIGRFDRPAVTFGDGARQELPARYLRFHTPRLQESLEQRARAAGVELIHAAFERADESGAGSLVELTDAAGHRRQLRCRVLVDCRGQVPAPSGRSRTPRGFQTAFGAWFEVDQLPFGPGEMCLMDLRLAPGAGKDGLSDPSFLYAAPDLPGLLFAQETVLAGRRAAPFRVLEARLRARLEGMGLRTGRAATHEHCLIPLGADPPGRASRALRFGAAAGMVQPTSGYSIARALREAPRVATALTAALGGDPCEAQDLALRSQKAIWPDDARRAWRLHQLGLEALLAGEGGDDAFWRSFFALPTDTISSFMDGGLPARAVAQAMWGVFLRVPSRSRFRLAASAARFVSRPSISRAAS